MKIVALDGKTLNPGDCTWKPLQQCGDFVVHDRTPNDQIVGRSQNADVLIVNKVRLDSSHIQQLPALKLVCVSATGFDVVDAAAAREANVVVCNVPEYSTMSVAQHAFALMLELLHQVARHDHLIRDGEWQQRGDFCFWETPLVELDQQQLGVVGWGRIGKQVAAIGQALGMQILVHSRQDLQLTDDSLIRQVSLDELFATADVVTLHCPLTNETRGMVNARRFAQMKQSAILINTARGAIVNELDLAAALSAGQLRGAGIDVCVDEPLPLTSELLVAPRLVITPHMAWGSIAARRRLIQTTADNVLAFAAGRPQNVVN